MKRLRSLVVGMLWRKEAIDQQEWEDTRPVKRAVAFLGTIKRSEHLKEHFNTVINAFKYHNPEATDVLHLRSASR